MEIPKALNTIPNRVGPLGFNYNLYLSNRELQIKKSRVSIQQYSKSRDSLEVLLRRVCELMIDPLRNDNCSIL